MTTQGDAASPPDAEHDDEALRWGDEQDATHIDAPGGAVRTPVRRDRPDAPTGSGTLVGLGVVGAVYLLYTVAWLVTVGTAYVSGVDAVLTVAVQVFRVLAVVAPAAWFGLTLRLTDRTRTRVVWLLVGAVVLVPWPFFMTRTIG